MLRAGLVLSVLLCSAAVAGESWYVAVGGDDAAAGLDLRPVPVILFTGPQPASAEVRTVLELMTPRRQHETSGR